MYSSTFSRQIAVRLAPPSVEARNVPAAPADGLFLVRRSANRWPELLGSHPRLQWPLALGLCTSGAEQWRLWDRTRRISLYRAVNHRVQVDMTVGVVHGEVVSTAACDDVLMAKPQSVLRPNSPGARIQEGIGQVLVSFYGG